MTPTKAALRAANEIAKAYGSQGGNYTRDAEIIDAEFAELVAALREARDDLVNLGMARCDDDWRNRSCAANDGEIDRIHARIDAALARVDSSPGE